MTCNMVYCVKHASHSLAWTISTLVSMVMPAAVATQVNTILFSSVVTATWSTERASSPNLVISCLPLSSWPLLPSQEMEGIGLERTVQFKTTSPGVSGCSRTTIFSPGMESWMTGTSRSEGGREGEREDERKRKER